MKSFSWTVKSEASRMDHGRTQSVPGSSLGTALPSPNYQWYVVAMLWFISFFNYADRQAIFSVFPLLENEMALTAVQLGLLGSAFAWVYGL
ncbi:MAG TPA: hypothetical protein VE398_26500, partial [Acidobacteriota bacterium]|nr:hypothetical protein [Acidobacteriota bacterium]